MDHSGSISLVSVNCGLPRQVPWHGGNVTTAIYKEPVKGRVAVRTLNLDGDRQADLSVNGGASKAVYCYPAAHYQYWSAELPGRELLAAPSARTSRSTAYWKTRSTLATRSRSVRHGSRANATTTSVLQTRVEIRIGRNGKAIPGQWPHGFY